MAVYNINSLKLQIIIKHYYLKIYYFIKMNRMSD